MEFTKENWENAPEEAGLEYDLGGYDKQPVNLVGFNRAGIPVVEGSEGNVWEGNVWVCNASLLRIVLPKRKVTVQLWRLPSGGLTTAYVDDARWIPGKDWALLGEHTFEIEGE